jgi:outer membrane protein
MRSGFASRVVTTFAASLGLIWSLGVSAPAFAQSAPGGPVTLNDAIQLALQNHPTVKESRARAQAADATIGVAQTAYLPRLDALWQVNRATHNNVFGLLLPQGVVPPVSGPVLGTTSSDSVWGSAGGVLLSWEAVDFGLRHANVDAARAQRAAAAAQTELTQLDIAAAAADAFLTVLAADERVRAAQANVERLQVFANSVRTLVQNQLRPGADQSRAEAELAIARNTLSQATETASIARATLANAIGAAGTAVQPDPALLGKLPASPDLPAMNAQAHPAARAEAAAITAVQARERAIDRSFLPHIDLQSAFAGRGSGAEAPGQSPLGDGLSLRVPNWAVGVSVAFPAFEVFSARAHKRVEIQNELAERARYEQVMQNLTTQEARARAVTTAASEIARNTPLERQAATEGETRARARYTSGLADVTEVAEAQRVLAQAEADDAVARLAVWRALLAAAQTRGDLTPFLDQIRQP